MMPGLVSDPPELVFASVAKTHKIFSRQRTVEELYPQEIDVLFTNGLQLAFTLGELVYAEGIAEWHADIQEAQRCLGLPPRSAHRRFKAKDKQRRMHTMKMIEKGDSGLYNRIRKGEVSWKLRSYGL